MANTPKTIVDVVEAVRDYTEEKFWDKSSQRMAGTYNILPFVLVSQVLSSVTCTVNADGSFSTSGTSNGASSVALNNDFMPPADGDYLFLGCPPGGSADTYSLRLYCPTDSAIVGRDTGSGVVVTLSKSKYYRAYFDIGSVHTNMNGLVFKPMLTMDLYATYADFVSYSRTSINLSNMVYIDTGSRKSYSIPVKGRQAGLYWIALMWMNIGVGYYGLFMLLVRSNNTVDIAPIVDHTNRTLSATCTNDVVTLTANAELWGGIRLFTLN